MKFVEVTSARLMKRMLGGCAVLMCLGCSQPSDRLPVYPVEGNVLYQGKPLPNALVALHPVDNKDPRAIAGRATSDGSGKFTVSTYDAHDGAPAGEYKVTVACYKLKGSGTSSEPGPNFLPAKYSQASTTPLTIRVAAAPTNSQQIEIK